ncbi:MAG TPA: methyltransferase [Acidobacteriota bacterium]|nr:methyltransferase [Acidobacteriota bacterium]
MDVLVICDRGFEKESSQEALSLIGKKKIVEYLSCFVIQDVDELDATHLAYSMQTAVKVGIHMGSCPYETDILTTYGTYLTSEVKTLIEKKRFKIVIKDHIKDGVIGDGHEMASKLGSLVKLAVPSTIVDVKKPEVQMCVYAIGDHWHTMIDAATENLSKREYRIFVNATALRATVAASLYWFAGAKPKHVILDPFSGSGTIAIEASLAAAHKSPHFYRKSQFNTIYDESVIQKKLAALDKDEVDAESSPRILAYDILGKNVDSAKKNAKIAGVLKFAHYARVEVDWIDLKVGDEVDRIITAPPQYSSSMDPAGIDKLYRQLFHRAKEVLKKSGSITILTNQPMSVKSLASPLFECEEVREVYMGLTCLFALRFVYK